MKHLVLFALFAVAAGDGLLDIPLLKPLDPVLKPLLQMLEPVTETLDDTFENFKNIFSKSYGGAEDLLRRSIFQQNLANILQHNLDGLTSYTLGINKYSDLSPAEISTYLMGFNGDNNFPSTGTVFKPSKNLQATATVDWRKKGLVTAVKDQGQCGCCYAFSTTGSLEGQMKKKTGNLVTLSEQNLVDCSQSQGNDGCDGGWMNQAFKFIKSNGGLDTEDAYPFKEAEGNCTFNKNGVGATVSSYVNIPSGDEKALMKAVASVGPVSVAINADGDFASYESGIYNPLLCPNGIQDMSHAVLVVGYGTESGQDYWIIKNSWGDSWGEKGFMRIARNKNNLCGVATKASYPVV